MSDALDMLAGASPGSFLDELRRRKPITRTGAQETFDALFAPSDSAAMALDERAAVALFVAALHDDQPGIQFYAALIADRSEQIRAEAARAATTGPYGAYPSGPLSAEDQPGLTYTSDFPDRRLAAAFAHAHMLVFHPRDAAPAHLHALEQAGWTADGIVTLSQLVAFLSFQLRAAAGLRALAAAR